MSYMLVRQRALGVTSMRNAARAIPQVWSKTFRNGIVLVENLQAVKDLVSITVVKVREPARVLFRKPIEAYTSSQRVQVTLKICHREFSIGFLSTQTR
jgi:hypothetical protein